MTKDDLKQIVWAAWQDAITRGMSGCTPAETARFDRWWDFFVENNSQYDLK